MATHSICPACGAPLRLGAFGSFCPVCQLRAGFDAPPPQEDLDPADPREERLDRLSSIQPRLADYQLIEEIGRGGMGVVYKARQLSLNRVVALKMSLAGPRADDVALGRFRAEAEIAARLRHPNIVAIHEIGQHEGRPYFSMDFVEGRNLSQMVHDGPLPPEQAALLVKTIAGAASFAHRHGIIHRDLKPSNILIDDAFEPRVTDFGVAKRSFEPFDLTATGEAVGSPSFSAPEQAAGRQAEVGPRSDIYSLGAILYFLLTGRPPLLGATLEETLFQVLRANPIEPRLLRPGIPSELQTICLKCLEKLPARRYATADDLRDELNRFLRREPIHARPVGRLEKGWRWCHRNPGLAALGASVVVLLGMISMTVLVAGVRLAAKEEAVRRNGYAADVRMAQQALAGEKFGQAATLLEHHRPAAGEKDLRGWEWRYLANQLSSDELYTLGRHDKDVLALAFSPDGARLASGDMNGTLKLWDLNSRREIFSQHHRDRVRSIAFSPNGAMLASASFDGTVGFWDARDLAEVAPPLDVTNRVDLLAFTPSGDQLFSVRLDPLEGFFHRTLVKWDLTTRRKIVEHSIDGWWGSVAFAPDASILATGQTGGRLTLWNTATGRRQAFWRGHAQNVVTVAFSPDGRWLASSGWEASVWDVRMGARIASLRSHDGSVNALAFAPDGKLFATAGYDRSVRLWDTDSWQQRASLRGYFHQIWTLAFSADGRHLASGGRDGAVKIWRAQTPPGRDEFIRLSGPKDENARVAAVAPDGAAVLWLGETGKLYLADLSPAGRSRLLINSGPTGSAWALSRGGNRAAMGSDTGQITLWNHSAASQPTRHKLTDRPITELVFSHDGRYLAAIVANRRIHLFDLATSQTTAQFQNPPSYFVNLAFSSDGKLLAAGAADSTALVWNIEQRSRVATVRGNKLSVTGISFSLDGKVLATAGGDGSISLWSVPSFRQIASFGAGSNTHWSLAWSPDGKRLATGTGTGTIKIWDPASGHDLVILEGHHPSTVNVQFLPDGQSLMSFAEGELFRWDAPPGRLGIAQ